MRLPGADEDQQKKPFASIRRWTAGVGRARGEGTMPPPERPLPPVPGVDEQNQSKEMDRNGEMSPGDDGSVGAYPRSSSVQRPPISRAQTWAHKMRPQPRLPAPPVCPTAPAPLGLPSSPVGGAEQSPALKARQRLPSLGSMPPSVKSTSATSSMVPSQPSSPSASFRPSSPSTYLSCPRSRRGSPPCTPGETIVSARTLTPPADSSWQQHNPFFSTATSSRSSTHRHTPSSTQCRPPSSFTPATSPPEPLSPTCVAAEGDQSTSSPSSPLRICEYSDSPPRLPFPTSSRSASPTHPYLSGRTVSSVPVVSPSCAIGNDDEHGDEECPFPRDIPVVYPLPASYSFLTISPPPSSANNSSDSLSDLAALSFSASHHQSYGSVAVESDIVDPIVLSFPVPLRRSSGVRVVQEGIDKEEDEVVPVNALFYDSHDIPSRFSDWTPTPSPSSAEASVANFPRLPLQQAEGHGHMQKSHLDNHLHRTVGAVRSFVDAGRNDLSSSASAAKILAASLSAASSPQSTLHPAERTALAEQRSKEMHIFAAQREVKRGSRRREEEGTGTASAKKCRSRATYPPSPCAPGAVWWFDDGVSAKGKEEARGRKTWVEMVDAGGLEKRASTGRAPLIGVVG
ncbi:hypothetical protein JCM11251_004396 [Rhodosporidiobolus azoricus]